MVEGRGINVVCGLSLAILSLCDWELGLVIGCDDKLLLQLKTAPINSDVLKRRDPDSNKETTFGKHSP